MRLMSPATSSDSLAIAELEMQLFPDNCMNEYTVAREIQAGIGLVVYVEKRLVAYVLVRCDLDSEILDILRLGVIPEYQNAGLGSRLLQEIISSSAYKVILTVRKSNSRALHVYKKHGFSITGELNKDNWVMTRSHSSCVE